MSEIVPQVIDVVPGRITVSHSEVESYLRCERQWFYGYGLEIQRNNESDSLTRGKIGHAGMEVFFNALMNGASFIDAKAAAYAKVMEAMYDHPILINEIIRCYGFFFDNYPFEGWKVLGVEYEQLLSVDDELTMPFIIDLVIQDPDGYVWVVDHKFIYDFISDRDCELMPQLPKYFVGMKALGFTVDKMAYSQFRYRTMKEENFENKYRFTPFSFTQTRLMQTITEQVVVSKRIQAAKKMPLEQLSAESMRTANKMVCNSCSFRSLCVAELNDWQPNLILNSEYMKKVRREFKEIEQV